MPIQIATLLRLSTKKQARRQGSEAEPDIPAQRAAIAEFLRSKPDWIHVREYREAGVSAFKVSADDRDVLQEALRDAAAGAWTVLVVYKADRLSRNSTEYPMVISRLHKIGCTVWSVTDAPGGKRLGLDSQTDKFIRFLEGWQAETESVNTQIRVAGRMKQLAREGRWCGSKVPFGYTLAAVRDESGEPLFRAGKAVRRLVPHPDRAWILQEIFRRYIGGQGSGLICQWLNQTGVPTYTGTAWSSVQVRGILGNPLYAGLISYGRHSRLGGGPVLVRGEHEPLIDPEVWERACEVRQNRRAVPPRQRPGTYALTGVLRCGKCGGPMGGITRRRTDAAGRPAVRQGYRCLTWANKRQCDVVELNGQRVEEAFLAALEDLERPSGLRSLMQTTAAEAARRTEADQAGRAHSAERLAVLKLAMARLDQAYLEAGAIGLEEYKAKKLAYTGEKEALEAALAAPAPACGSTDFDGLVRLAGEVRANWAYMTPEERKVFVVSLMQAHRLTAFIHPGMRVELRPLGGTVHEEAAAD